MRSRSLVSGATLVLLLSLLVAGTAHAGAGRQVVPVMWHPQTSMAGPVAPGAQASLVRKDGGVTFNLTTSHLRPGHAYTLWFVVVNNPAACTSTPCSGPDIILNAATDSQVTYGAGHISGKAGRGSFAGSFPAGDLEGWLPDRDLADPRTAEIQLVLNDHGPKLQGFMPGMIQTYRAGCTDASLPGIFPPSARADGAPGPNACQLYQVAAFSAP